MQSKNLSKISSNVINFFSKTVSEIDKVVKFVKRKSKLTAKLFAEAVILGCFSDTEISLERMCLLLKQRGIKISKQGLHQRFNTESSALMKNIFTESLNQFRTESDAVIDLLKPFSGVKLLDSSGISLPQQLKDVYKGYGGNASDAGLKLQTLFDYIKGQLNDVTITEAIKSDQGFNDHLFQIKEGELYLQDLGYFKRKAFAIIESKKAYFVSRYLAPTKIFDDDNQPIDLLNALRNARPEFSKNVWLFDEKNKISVRLIAYRLSDTAAEKRIRKLKKNGEKKGRTPTQETIELAKWSIYITNVSKDKLTDEQVYLVYTLRWQIELFFKLCKSEAGIDQVRGKKTDRIICEIYAKLICVVILLHLCSLLRWQDNCEISFQKAYKQLRQRGMDFFKSMISPYRLMKFFNEFLNDLRQFAFKDKYRKKRPATYHKLMNSTGQVDFV